jgi:hypothetical protein
MLFSQASWEEAFMDREVKTCIQIDTHVFDECEECSMTRQRGVCLAPGSSTASGLQILPS